LHHVAKNYIKKQEIISAQQRRTVRLCPKKLN